MHGSDYFNFVNTCESAFDSMEQCETADYQTEFEPHCGLRVCIPGQDTVIYLILPY